MQWPLPHLNRYTLARAIKQRDFLGVLHFGILFDRGMSGCDGADRDGADRDGADRGMSDRAGADRAGARVQPIWAGYLMGWGDRWGDRWGDSVE